MNIIDRVQREIKMFPVMHAGYSRKMASIWYRKTKYDFKAYANKYDKDFIKQIHQRGYLCRSVEKYNLLENINSDYVSDFSYIYLSPYNNSFSKWIGDMLTTNMVLNDHRKHLRTIHFSIIQRDRKQLILGVLNNNKECKFSDIMKVLNREKALELRPSFWSSKKPRYKIEKKADGIYIDNKLSTQKRLKSIISNLKASYVIADYISIYRKLSDNLTSDHSIKFWIANDIEDKPKILFAVFNLFYYAEDENGRLVRKHDFIPFDLENGSFEYNGETITVENWEEKHNDLLAVARSLRQLNFFTTAITLKKDGFKFVHFSANPYLPAIPFNSDLNEYLKRKSKEKKENSNWNFKDRIEAYKENKIDRFIAKHCRKGVRPYMQKLWFEAVKADLFNTKDVSLPKKIWAWKRGFLSYRTYQYGLTKENYKEFLSDYDYYWLNRINNYYQVWVNDKTTFRYVMEPFKEYIPEYYFSLFRRNGKNVLSKMQDCPENINEDYDGLFELLKMKGMLVLKPSSGTHGDGFYCLGYENNYYFVNGEQVTREDIIDIIQSLKSFYIITEYVVMNKELKKIYPKSVNTVRVMVINRKGYNPKIQQTYMRIGSSKTGYTDNVGYGGICVMIDSETGELYKPETIKNHIFYPCPNHPDTGTEISGKLANWDLVRTKIIEVSRYLSELEYLGFDIAITDDGFQILEINIHQDLHKVPTFNEEVKDFFTHKINWKMH